MAYGAGQCGWASWGGKRGVFGCTTWSRSHVSVCMVWFIPLGTAPIVCHVWFYGPPMGYTPYSWCIVCLGYIPFPSYPVTAHGTYPILHAVSHGMVSLQSMVQSRNDPMLYMPWNTPFFPCDILIMSLGISQSPPVCTPAMLKSTLLYRCCWVVAGRGRPD